MNDLGQKGKKSGSYKLKLLYLVEMLQKSASPKHGLTMTQITDRLNAKGISAEQKAIYDDLAALEEAQYQVKRVVNPITGKELRPPQYYIANRHFETDELFLMIDAIQASKYLTSAQTKKLIEKLKDFCPEDERARLNRPVLIANRVKREDKSVQDSIGIINHAISLDRQVKFRLSYFDENKKKRFRKQADTDGFYIVSPYKVIYTDDCYYLLAFEHRTQKKKHFRVDRMEKLEEIPTRRIGQEAFKQLEKSKYRDYTTYTFSMYGDKPAELVTLSFTNDLMTAVIERFGRDVVTSTLDDRHFKVTVSVVVSPMFFSWLFGFGNKAVILAPESARREMKRMLEKTMGKYE